MQTGWLDWDNDKFFLRSGSDYPSTGPYGSMVMAWQYLSGYWYYFDAQNSSGRMLKTQLIGPGRTGNNSSNWGYVDGNGRGVTGWQWLGDGGSSYWFYFDSAASMLTSRVIYDSTGPCWLKSNGRAAQSEYVTISGRSYYVDSSYHIQGY
jgi:glucan-binding YG repeat protein